MLKKKTMPIRLKGVRLKKGNKSGKREEPKRRIFGW